MTREEIIKVFNTLLILKKVDCTKDELEECCKAAIKALEQEPTTKNDLGVDCISREQAKEAIRDKFKDLSSRVEINTILNDLPSVTPQEPILDQISEIIEPLRHLPIGEMSDIEWDILRVIDKYKGESEDNGNDD